MLNQKMANYFLSMFQGTSYLVTDGGTPAMWKELEDAGYVTKAPMRPNRLIRPLFSYNITAKGKALLAVMRKLKGEM